jgi:hypothetical protein
VASRKAEEKNCSEIEIRLFEELDFLEKIQ